jgi:hypothetical protein
VGGVALCRFGSSADTTLKSGLSDSGGNGVDGGGVGSGTPVGARAEEKGKSDRGGSGAGEERRW